MKKLTLGLALIALLGMGSQAVAVIPTIDDVPAATLLLPYFEVDLNNPNGINTLFSVNNASATSQLAHVTVWSNASIPVLDFDIYLTGYDVQTLNLYNILVNGILPQTGSGTNTAANDPGSPLGLYSGPDVLFPNCNNTSSPPIPPVYTIPGLSTTFRAHLAALLTGGKSPVDGTCAGVSQGDSIARGYITIDDVNACSLLFPSQAGYFAAGGTGIADNDNVLWGDYFYVNAGENFAQGETLVHIEAVATGDTSTFLAGDYTFYGRYVGGTAIDGREPLGTSYAARYLTGGGFDGGTDFIVWRDSKLTPGFSCATGPNYDAMFEAQLVAFDEEENPFTIVTGGPSGEPTPGAECTFCDEAQRVNISVLNTPDDFGWLYMNLNHTNSGDLLGPGYVDIAQAWASVVMSAQGRFSVGFDAIQLDNASSATPGGICLRDSGATIPCFIE